MIIIPDYDERLQELWQALLELAAAHPDAWTLVGAQMVFLHALEHEAVPPRVSVDLDLVIDIRADQRGIKKIIGTLERHGYEFDGASSAGIGHRFVRDRVRIDVLAPDQVGKRADIRTCAGARTVNVPGGTQALRRTSPVTVRAGDRKGEIPRPDLLGAILIKARAIGVDDAPQNQRQDLAFLLTLIDDPGAMASELRGNERSWLRERSELLDPNHPAWLSLDGSEDGRLAFRVLADL